MWAGKYYLKSKCDVELSVTYFLNMNCTGWLKKNCPLTQNDKGKCKLDVSSTEETREQNMPWTKTSRMPP